MRRGFPGAGVVGRARADVGRAAEVLGRHRRVVHAHVVGRGVEQPRLRRVGGRRGRAHPALEAGADPLHVALGRAGLLGGVQHRAAGLEIDALGPGHLDVGRGGEHLAGGAVQRVLEAVLVERDQRLPYLTADLDVRQDHGGDGVVVPVVVGRELVGPHQRPVGRMAREDARGPLVVARAAARRCRVTGFPRRSTPGPARGRRTSTPTPARRRSCRRCPARSSSPGRCPCRRTA